MNFVPLPVGGGDSQQTYQVDSFPCASAVRAGIIKDSAGGCATTTFSDVLPLENEQHTRIVYGLRNVALAVNISAACLLCVVLRPKFVVLYWFLVCIGFWHVALCSQPQQNPPPLDVAFGAFLPPFFLSIAASGECHGDSHRPFSQILLSK